MPDFDRYCIYCQRQYATERNLWRHIIRAHRNTTAYWRVIPDEFRQQHSG